MTFTKIETQDAIHALVPQPKGEALFARTPMIQLQYTVNFSEDFPSYQDKFIKKIRYIVAKKDNNASRNAYIAGFFLSFTDGSKLLCPEFGIWGLGYLARYCLANGFNDTAAAIGSSRVDDWSGITLQRYYQLNQTELFYQMLYQIYAKYILSFLEDKNDSRSILLVEPGCGDGRCSKYIMERIQSQTSRHIVVAGFDINEQNIQQAKQNLGSNTFLGRCEFDKINIFLQAVTENWSHMQLKDPIIIALYSGILSSCVSSGSREALTIIQNITRDLSPDLSIVGSFTPLLINKSIFSRIGLEVARHQPTPPQPEVEGKLMSTLYFLKPRSFEAQMAKQISWSDKRARKWGDKNNLDLSMCTNPLFCIDKLSKYHATRLSSVSQLDLSYSLIKVEDISSMAQMIQNLFPGLTHLLFSKTDTWHKSLAENLQANKLGIKFCYRMDASDMQSVPTLSVALARQIGLFATMPNELYGARDSKEKEINIPCFK